MAVLVALCAHGLLYGLPMVVMDADGGAGSGPWAPPPGARSTGDRLPRIITPLVSMSDLPAVLQARALTWSAANLSTAGIPPSWCGPGRPCAAAGPAAFPDLVQMQSSEVAETAAIDFGALGALVGDIAGSGGGSTSTGTIAAADAVCSTWNGATDWSAVDEFPQWAVWDRAMQALRVATAAAVGANESTIANDTLGALRFAPAVTYVAAHPANPSRAAQQLAYAPWRASWSFIATVSAAAANASGSTAGANGSVYQAAPVITPWSFAGGNTGAPGWLGLLDPDVLAAFFGSAASANATTAAHAAATALPRPSFAPLQGAVGGPMKTVITGGAGGPPVVLQPLRPSEQTIGQRLWAWAAKLWEAFTDGSMNPPNPYRPSPSASPTRKIKVAATPSPHPSRPAGLWTAPAMDQPTSADSSHGETGRGLYPVMGLDLQPPPFALLTQSAAAASTLLHATATSSPLPSSEQASPSPSPSTLPSPSAAPAVRLPRHSTALFGGLHPEYAASVMWSEPAFPPLPLSEAGLQATYTRWAFSVYQLEVCGMPLLPTGKNRPGEGAGAGGSGFSDLGGSFLGASDAFTAEIDTTSACIALPAAMYDAVMATIPVEECPAVDAPRGGSGSDPQNRRVAGGSDAVCQVPAAALRSYTSGGLSLPTLTMRLSAAPSLGDWVAAALVASEIPALAGNAYAAAIAGLPAAAIELSMTGQTVTADATVAADALALRLAAATGAAVVGHLDAVTWLAAVTAAARVSTATEVRIPLASLIVPSEMVRVPPLAPEVKEAIEQGRTGTWATPVPLENRFNMTELNARQPTGWIKPTPPATATPRHRPAHRRSPLPAHGINGNPASGANMGQHADSSDGGSEVSDAEAEFHEQVHRLPTGQPTRMPSLPQPLGGREGASHSWCIMRQGGIGPLANSHVVALTPAEQVAAAATEPLVSRIRLGTLALHSLYVAFDLRQGRVGLANKDELGAARSEAPAVREARLRQAALVALHGLPHLKLDNASDAESATPLHDVYAQQQCTLPQWGACKGSESYSSSLNTCVAPPCASFTFFSLYDAATGGCTFSPSTIVMVTILAVIVGAAAAHGACKRESVAAHLVEWAAAQEQRGVAEPGDTGPVGGNDDGDEIVAGQQRVAAAVEGGAEAAAWQHRGRAGGAPLALVPEEEEDGGRGTGGVAARAPHRRGDSGDVEMVQMR